VVVVVVVIMIAAAADDDDVLVVVFEVLGVSFQVIPRCEGMVVFRI